MTQAEIRAMLARVNPRKLRQDAGIRTVTVARALGVQRQQVVHWETTRCDPRSAAAYRWAKVVAGLERHAIVAAEIAAMRDGLGSRRVVGHLAGPLRF